MARQGAGAWPGDPRNATCQVAPDPAGCEQEAEQAAQAHRLVVEARPAGCRIGRIEESHNVVARDGVQVTGFRTEPEGQESPQHPLANRDGLRGESPLPCRGKFNADVHGSGVAIMYPCAEPIDGAPVFIDRLCGVAETAQIRQERVAMRRQLAGAGRCRRCFTIEAG